VAERFAGPLLYMTGGPRGLHCLRALIDAGETIGGVIGHPGQRHAEAAAFVEDRGIPYRDPESPNDADTLAWIDGLGCRLAVMSGYSRILRARLIERFADGVINLHGGPLPRYRGGSPLNWQIVRGEKSIGVSILFTEPGIDTGTVLAADEFPLGPEETIDSVVERSLPCFANLLLGVLAGLRDGSLEPRAQDEARARYFAKRLPEDGWIDWQTSTAQQVHDLVRALGGSYPGAFTGHGGRKLVIESTRCLDEVIIGPPGRVLARRSDGVEVACADRAVLVTQVRDSDRGTVPAGDAMPPRNATFDRLPPAT